MFNVRSFQGIISLNLCHLHTFTEASAAISAADTVHPSAKTYLTQNEAMHMVKCQLLLFA